LEARVNAVLLSAGVACVIAAVVGGGLKAFGIDVPVITSLKRQSVLFVVGILFLVSAWLLRDRTGGPDKAESAYRQLVVATCGRIVKIRTADFPIDVIDISSDGIRFHKEPLVGELRRRQANMQAELASLWVHQTPANLRPRRHHAEDVSGAWLQRVTEEIKALQATAPDPVSQADADVLERPSDIQLRAQVNDAMTDLAGQDCPLAG